MASHNHHHHHGGCHHHHQNHRETIPHIPFNHARSPPPCCCADSHQSNHHLSPPPNLDHLLRLLAAYLQTHQTPCSCETTSQRFTAEYGNLLRKVEDLDLSFTRFAEQRRHSHHSALKDSAARVIQTHFRSYLVHRSVSLRQLKELATIKSRFLSLKSSVSGKTHFHFQAVSRQATDLLLHLESIQGRVDSMILDGKRSLCRDLLRFLHYVDDCAVKRRNIVAVKERTFVAKRHVGEERPSEKLRRKMGTVYVTSNGDYENIAELEEFHFMSDDAQQSRKGGTSKSRVAELAKGNRVKTPVTKTVKFGKNRNVYELTSSAEDDSFGDGEEVLMISRDDDGVGNNSRSKVLTKGSGGKTRVVKTVSFDENGNVYKVYGDTPETSVSEGDDSSTSGSNIENGDGYNEVEDIKFVPKENEGSGEGEEEEESHSEEEEEPSSEGSKEEEQDTENVSRTGKKEHKREFQLRKGSSMFSPPLPLKMEP